MRGTPKSRLSIYALLWTTTKSTRPPVLHILGHLTRVVIRNFYTVHVNSCSLRGCLCFLMAEMFSDVFHLKCRAISPVSTSVHVHKCILHNFNTIRSEKYSLHLLLPRGGPRIVELYLSAHISKGAAQVDLIDMSVHNDYTPDMQEDYMARPDSIAKRSCERRPPDVIRTPDNS